MKFETIMYAMIRAAVRINDNYYGDQDWDVYKRLSRQHRAFRDRIIRMDDEKDMGIFNLLEALKLANSSIKYLLAILKVEDVPLPDIDKQLELIQKAIERRDK